MTRSPGRPPVVSRAIPWLAAAAAVNLAAGLWMSLQPERSSDVYLLAKWAAQWGIGEDPYASPISAVDYPPWALVLLWPLSQLSPTAMAIAWVLINLGCLAALSVRLAQESRETPRVQAALALLLAATACARTLNQFSLVAFTLAWFGAYARSPLAGALSVGLALFKPQIGGVVFVWMLLRRQGQRAALALAVPIALLAIFAARVHVHPATAIAEYSRALARIHGRPEVFVGHTEVRGWLAAIWPAHGADLLTAGLLGAVLLVPAALASRRSPAWTRDEGLLVLALCGAASLLAVRHLSYDFILLWPAIVAWRVAPFAERRATPSGLARFAVLAGMMVLGLPSWARFAQVVAAAGSLEWVTELDRVVALGAWIGLSWQAWRLARGSRE